MLVEEFAEEHDNMEEEKEEDKQEDEEDDEIVLNEDEKTEELIENFYNMFLIYADGSSSLDNVNMATLLKAVPTRILSLNID